jgi:hypothetical protein
MREHGAVELLEKRIHQANMKEFLENNPETHPPGLHVDQEYGNYHPSKIGETHERRYFV